LIDNCSFYDVVNLDFVGTSVTLRVEGAKLEAENKRLEAEITNLVEKNTKLEAEQSTLENREYVL